MEYQITPLKHEFEIENIVTVHYFEYSKDYLFFGESHDFWELLYVDKGEITVRAGEKYIVLKRGQMIFHKPNEFHMVIANGVVAPNLVVVSFNCHSTSMDFFCDRIVTLTEDCKKYVSRIITEANTAFSCKLNDPLTKQLIKREESKFGCEQLIAVYLQLLLIGIVRAMDEAVPAISSTIHQRYSDGTYTRMINYLEQNIGENLSLDALANHFFISKTSLKSIFKEHNNLGIMEYLSLLRMERAKQFIREEAMNFTKISEALGFSSVHYFSRVFKKQVGMTPSEYATSIKVLIDSESV